MNAARLLIVLAGSLALLAATTPTPAPKPTPVDLLKLEPKGLLPKTQLHTEFVVEVNKLGQVTRIRSAKTSSNGTFNAQTYGNALQAFIRTTDGKVVLGTYRLTYDYNPQTQRVRRDVSLVKTGGVDPNAKGAVQVMEEDAKRHPPSLQKTPNPVPSVRIERAKP